MTCKCGWTKEKEEVWLQHLFTKIWGRTPSQAERKLILNGLEKK